MQRNSGSTVLGMLLAFMGLFFLLNNFGFMRGEGFLLFLGLGFVGAYFIAGRQVGLLVPGATLVALGAFTILERGFFGFRLGGGWFFIMMGLGFAAIFIIDSAGRSRPTIWPLYPAAGLLLFGLFITATEVVPRSLWRLTGMWWPAVLVLIGLAMILRPGRS